MIYIHTHILFDVDDGSDTITESVDLVKSAISAGVTGIIFTPHYTGNTKKDYRNENVDKHFSELVKEIKERNLEIDIFLGNEIAVYEMKMRGITPIIAHPESCECFKRDFSLVDKAIKEGACIQVNVGSVFGDYGRKAKKIARKLLKNKSVHFLASDNHHIIRDKYSVLPKRLHKLNRMFGSEYINELTIYNQEKILRNEEI